MEIILRQKPMPTNGDLLCSCGAPLMASWQGCPVIACEVLAGEMLGPALCRVCAGDASPLLVALADLAGAAGTTRPSKGTEPILDAAAHFRLAALDSAQVARVDFRLQHGIEN